jgi:hypothetical protein
MGLPLTYLSDVRSILLDWTRFTWRARGLGVRVSSVLKRNMNERCMTTILQVGTCILLRNIAMETKSSACSNFLNTSHCKTPRKITIKQLGKGRAGRNMLRNAFFLILHNPLSLMQSQCRWNSGTTLTDLLVQSIPEAMGRNPSWKTNNLWGGWISTYGNHNKNIKYKNGLFRIDKMVLAN